VTEQSKPAEKITRKRPKREHARPDQIAYTPLEACEALRIGRTKLYELLGSGALSAIALGGKTLIKRDELLRFVDSLPQIPLQRDSENNHKESATK